MEECFRRGGVSTALSILSSGDPEGGEGAKRRRTGQIRWGDRPLARRTKAAPFTFFGRDFEGLFPRMANGQPDACTSSQEAPRVVVRARGRRSRGCLGEASAGAAGLRGVWTVIEMEILAWHS